MENPVRRGRVDHGINVAALSENQFQPDVAVETVLRDFVNDGR
jgi:hypothetical protein